MALKPVGRSKPALTAGTAAVGDGSQQRSNDRSPPKPTAVELLEKAAYRSTARPVKRAGSATARQNQQKRAEETRFHSQPSELHVEVWTSSRADKSQKASSSSKRLLTGLKTMRSNGESATRQAAAALVACELAANNFRAGSAAAKQNAASLAENSRMVGKLPAITAQAAEQNDRSKTAIDDVISAEREVERLVKGMSALARQAGTLSFNATMEAARPGAGANGFAILATEFQTLARRLSRTTKRVRRQLEVLRDSGRTASRCVEETSTALNAIHEGVATTGRMLCEQSVKADAAVRELSDAANALREATAVSTALKQSAENCVKTVRQLESIAESLSGEKAA
jgi:methyl-accepting chemotaxis protein